jgi:hypothetical protein
MLSKLVRTSALVLVTLLLGSTIWAQSAEITGSSLENPGAATTVTYSLNGTMGPILAGTDPLGLNGQSASVTVKANAALKPVKHTATSATYKLPKGAISGQAGSDKFTTTTPSQMVIVAGKRSSLTLAFTVSSSGQKIVVKDVTDLAANSFTRAALKHPTAFSPSPQNVTAAQKKGGPGCQFYYLVEGNRTDLGFGGTASSGGNSADAEFEDEDQ